MKKMEMLLETIILLNWHQFCFLIANFHYKEKDLEYKLIKEI